MSSHALLMAPPGAAADSGPATDVIQQVVDLAHRCLQMDLTFVARFVDEKQEFRAISGDGASFEITLGDGPPLSTTFCSRMVVGEIPSFIPDTGADSRVRYLPITQQMHIGAYIAVPLRLSDGTLYGSLCCLSHTPQHRLSARDVLYLRLLADLVVADLDRELRGAANHALVSEVLDGGEVAIALQPVIDLETGCRLGVEALARFPARFGTPETLFPMATQVGLGIELEQLAATRALSLASGLTVGEFLSINLSPWSIAAWPALVDRCGPVAEDRLVIEITEHQIIDRYDGLVEALAPLRERGTRVAIDNVGAGYASLHHVLQLQPTQIKIDRKLVDSVAVDRARRSVIRGFVGLGAEIGALVVAEGVERESDLEALLELGVRAGQGYLLGRPSLEHPEPLPAPLPR